MGVGVAGAAFASADAGIAFVEGGGTFVSGHGLDTVSDLWNNEQPQASSPARIAGNISFMPAVNRAPRARSIMVWFTAGEFQLCVLPARE